MSFKRYYNEDAVKGVTPVFGEDFSSNINSSVDKVQTKLMLNDVDGKYLGGIKVDAVQELHIYGADNLIESTYTTPIKYKSNGSYPILKVNPELDLRTLGIRQGVYSLNYNFLNKFVKGCKIEEINGDRSEIRVSANGTNKFEELLTILSSNSSLNSFTKQGTLPELVMNFKSNELYNVVNISFEGPPIGVVQETLQYPRDRFDNISTTYIPIDEGTQTLESWRLFVEVYTPAIGESTLNSGKTTGRARRFKLKKNKQQPGYLIWEAGVNTFAGNTLPAEVASITLTNTNGTVERGAIIRLIGGQAKVLAQIAANRLKLTYNRWDYTPSSYDKVVLKLDRPLGFEFNEGTTFDLDGRVYDSYIEKIIAFPSIDNVDRPDFSEPNFNMDMSHLHGADGTNWQNWNSLLDVNATTSQQLISYYFSGSLGNTKLNIDYSDFSNFVHFSSATERVDNFVYKLQQIENYNNRINLLGTVSGSDALTNISQSMVRRDNLIGGFDEFENYLYYGTDSNNYTHWSSSAYTIEPYPKVSTFPHILYPTTASQGELWYAGVYDSASLYDEFNDARLRNMIPIHLQEDERNTEYITFVDMIGQHFDIQWTYIKSLTDINRREEHPKDGMADNLLKDVADSFGWKLSNGYSDVSLWKYALGTEEDGTLFTTGSLQTKSRQQIVHETWRRIVNTLPMLYKTKGTARSIKAILATYGIPQAFLKIREWGGPTVSTQKNVFEHERFVNKLQLSPSKYTQNPWVNINGDRPNSIEVIGKMPKGNYHILKISTLNGDIDYFWDYNRNNETARIRATWGAQAISSSYVPYKTIRDAAFVISSGSATIQAAWVDDWGHLLANPTASMSSPSSDFRDAWNYGGFGWVMVPGDTTDSNIYNYETASIQEIRYYRDVISNEIVTEHAKNREAYFSDDNTTDLDIDTSYDKLVYRIFPDSRLNTITSSILSSHPNQKITTGTYGVGHTSILSSSLRNIKPSDLVGEVDTQFVTIPSMGALNLMNNKIRIESASLKGPLDPDKSNELSEHDYAPLDSNLLGTYFSTTDTVNFDIYNSEGYFEADDWVGDPDKRYNADYPLLKYRAKNYFQKYTSGTAIDLILDMLSRYDMSVWSQIQQLLPARVDWHNGILIEPHIFERNKYRRNRDITISRHMYDGRIQVGKQSLSSSRHDYGYGTIDLYDYQPSTYRYYIPTVSGSLTCTTPLSSYITSSTTLNSKIGVLATDYLRYNSTNYLITNRISNTKLQINTSLPAASTQTGTLYYTGSFDMNNQTISASREVSTSITTPLTASADNRTSININDTSIGLQNFASYGVNSSIIAQWHNKAVRLKCTYNNVGGTDIFSNGSDETDAMIQVTPNFQANLIGTQTLSSIPPTNAQFWFSFDSSSIQTTHQPSNLVYKFGGANWPADAAEMGNLVFDDGNGSDLTYPVLERVGDRVLRIDTSSHQPNTSGSYVNVDLQYSSSAQTSITFTIGDPTLITCVSSSTYVDLSNGYWQYSPTGSTVLKATRSKIYQVPKYFYSTEFSASINSPNSSSMIWWEGQDDRLPLALENLYYNGCRISSDALTTESPDTPDGGPVVEITKVDPNVLVYSTQTPADGGVSTTLPVGSGTPKRVMPEDVLQSVNIKNKKKSNVNTAKDVSTLNSVLTPLPFKPKQSIPVLRPSKAQSAGSFAIAKAISSFFSIYNTGNVYLYDGNFNGNWSTLTRVQNATFVMSVNGNISNKQPMQPTNEIEVRNVQLNSTQYVGQTTTIIGRVYVVNKNTGQIVWATESDVMNTAKTFTLPYKPFDLEVRIMVMT